MKLKSLFSLRKWIMLYLSKANKKKFSDEKFLKLEYFASIGKKLNLDNPQTYNEKLQWLKLYDRKPEYTTMVDKYAAKKYVADKIGEEYIIPTLGVWESFDDIDFDSLPNQFVLKCTHDSGGLVICKDKSTFDIQKAKERIEKFLRRDYFNVHREWPYKDVPKKIIAEQFMTDKNNEELKDYKIFCFNGKPEIVLVCSDRFSETGLRENFYDTSWNLLPVKRPAHPNSENEIKVPKNLDQMLELARKLSKEIPFSRIDFYDINDKIFFGEITFFPASGFENFEPDEWDYTLGSWITLPEKTVNR